MKVATFLRLKASFVEARLLWTKKLTVEASIVSEPGAFGGNNCTTCDRFSANWRAGARSARAVFAVVAALVAPWGYVVVMKLQVV